MRGKQEVIAGWSEFFKPSVAPFRWRPERVVTNAAGDLGFSSGPVFDEAGVQIGTFTSTWVRQPDGSWKILFDGGSACPTTKQSRSNSPAIEQSRNLLIRQGERNDCVFRAMIGPEQFAVESQ